MKPITTFYVLLRLVLGGMMLYGGVQKFTKPLPEPVAVVEKARKFTDPGQQDTLQKVLYINGVKQTGYFWQVLGICELLFGLLVLLQGTSLVGALFLLPITLHIVLFHLFLEPDEPVELLQTAGLFAINVALVLKEYKRWKSLLWLSV